MTTWATSGATALAEHAPDVVPALEALAAMRPADVEAATAAAIRTACAETQGLPPLHPAGTTSGAPPEVVAFAEQFATDVTRVDDDVRGAFTAATGSALFSTVQLVYVADQGPRLRAGLDALFGPSDWGLREETATADSWQLVDELIRSVARGAHLDPVLTELVRLRGARQHHCRLCSSRRSSAAIEGGADDAMFAAVDAAAASDLPARTKAALALVDDLIWTPARIQPNVLGAVRGHLSPAEAVEVVLDVVRNAANKIAVALGADAPTVTDGVELFTTDADGNVLLG